MTAAGAARAHLAAALSPKPLRLLPPRRAAAAAAVASAWRHRRPSFGAVPCRSIVAPARAVVQGEAASGSQSAAFSARPGLREAMGEFRLIPSKSLHVSTPTWWLESRFHFSFAEYYNPSNSGFGVLRVLNDDLVKPHAGFGTHPHANMEIVTYVVDGQLTHKDSTGTGESLGRGSVQYMSAGRGITHLEMNDGNDLLRFLQLWIKPNKKGLTPNYGSRVFSKAARHNKLQHVLTSVDVVEEDSGSGVFPVHQDANIYVSEMDPGFVQEYILQKQRQLYLVCIEGGLSLGSGHVLRARDAIEVLASHRSELPLKLHADTSSGAHIFFVEMAQARGALD